MTNGEIQTIRNIVARLKKPNCGCSNTIFNDTVKQIVALAETTKDMDKVEVVSRLYLDTWVIPSLEMLLPEGRNVDLALSMSR